MASGLSWKCVDVYVGGRGYLMPGPKAPALILTEAERAELERLVRRAHGSQALATRARIILACSEPESTNTAVAYALGVCRPSVIEWRTRFAAQRLAGLSDAHVRARRAPCRTRT